MPKLPEEFAPTGPKLSRFPIQSAPPIRPRLFNDEMRWVLQLAALAALSELLAWMALAWSIRWSVWTAVAIGTLRLTRPFWALLGTRVSRAAIAVASFTAAILLSAMSLRWAPLSAAIALPALGDLLASAIGDTITVERRATAYAWLDIGQGLGAALGFGIGFSGLPQLPFLAVALLIAPVLARSLRDRGTPRSTWPLAAYVSTLRMPLGTQLAVLAALCAGLCAHAAELPSWALVAAILIGMALAARIEPLLPNAIWLPRLAVALAVLGLLWPPSRMLAMGMMFAAIPSAVARGAGEMDRPIVSSLAWSALILGAAVGAVI